MTFLETLKKLDAEATTRCGFDYNGPKKDLASMLLRNNTQAIIELVEAVKNLRHHNKFDGTWVEANDWERMQDALSKLKGDV